MRHDRFEGDDALDQLHGPHPMSVLAAVMFAGAVGVALRYVLDSSITSSLGDSLPWSTLVVNVVGALALGVVVALPPFHSDAWDIARPALTIGLLGGFTTFSALTVEAVTMAQDGLVGRASLYVATTNGLGVLATIAGMTVVRGISGLVQ